MSLSENDERAIELIVDWMSAARRLLFITGAGISADSGLPTYRGFGGLYNDDQATRHGVRIEEALSGTMMTMRPDVTWEHLFDLELASRGATFNRGHQVIAEMESHFEAVWTLTQNVDGFHRRAGSKNVIDIHGDLHQLECTRCHHRESVESFEHLAPLPECSHCGAILRPDVVLFEELLPVRKVAVLSRELEKGFDLVFAIGTSCVFPYIVEPVLLAQERGMPTVEINPDDTSISDIVSVKIAAGAAETLGRLWDDYREKFVSA